MTVAAHLLSRVQHRLASILRNVYESVTCGLGICPLLQLNQHIGRLTRLRMNAAQQSVYAFGRVRQLVFQQDFDVTEASVLEIPKELRKAHFPRAQLADAGACVELDTGLLSEQFVKLLRLRLDQQ